MSKKSLMLIYNPYAGRRKLAGHLDSVIRIFQEGGYEVSIHRTNSPKDLEYTAEQCQNFDTVVVAGGDGSIHQAVNGLLRIETEKRPVLGILPVGTANDLAFALKLPKNMIEACEVIAHGSSIRMDLGMVNERYFVNVFSAGLLSDVSPKVDIQIKNRLGQLAYYLKGIETLPSFRPFRVEYEFGGKTYQEEALLILAINGLSVGGHRQLAPEASITDGKLDFLLVRQSDWPDTMRMLLHWVGGGIMESDRIEQFQATSLSITTDRIINSDLDGEWGPDSPWDIRIGPKISVLSPIRLR